VERGIAESLARDGVAVSTAAGSAGYLAARRTRPFTSVSAAFAEAATLSARAQAVTA
jgi:hypothetical protein